MKTSHVIPLAIVIGGLVVALAVYISTPKAPSAGSGNPALVRPVDATDHILGNPAAPVQIIEYADFDCEFCKGFDDTLHQVIANQGATGKVAWVYREFPLIEIHPNAMKHAEAAECVAQTTGNNAFWAFKTTLFNNQPVDPLNYGSYAKAVGVVSDAFASCYASAATSVDARIKADRQNALDMGARGTPYSVIVVVGKAPVVIPAAYPYDAVRDLVAEALTR